MGRRAALLLSTAALALLLGAFGLSTFLLREARRSVDELLTRRLEAVGATTARLLSAATPGPVLDEALGEVARKAELDGAYVFDTRFRVVADAQGRSGQAANLLRLDPDRAAAALGGHSSVGWAFDLEGLRFFGGYFPVPKGALGGRPLALAVEAGERFTSPSRKLRAAAIAAFTVEGALGVVVLAAIGLALRAARREREAYGAAERAGLASRMAAMVAHEVRNPLGIIRGGAELLRERLKGPSDRELVDDILGEVQRLNQLTEEFLDLARDPPLRLEPLALAPLFDEAAAKLRLRYPALRLEVEIATSLEVYGDRRRLWQALLNLLVNAAQATDGRGRVRIHGSPVGAFVLVRLTDDGPGVDPAIARRLFEPFNTGKVGGTGLGLALARKIIERHGGRIELAPADLRTGACFDVWLPSPGRGSTAERGGS